MGLHITYAGVPLYSADDSFGNTDKWNARKWDYFSVPWTASTFGRGKALVTFDALKRIEAKVLPEEGPQRPELLVLATIETEEQVRENTLIFQNIYLSASQPVHTRRVLSETDDNRDQEGVWEIELVDKRAVLMGTLTDLKVNIREPRGTCYYDESLNNGEVWKYKDVLDKLFTEIGVRTEDIPVPLFAPSKGPEDINLHQVPVPIALDYVANQMGLSIHYNPEDDKWTLAAIGNTEIFKKQLDLIKKFHFQGGQGKLYPAVSSARLYKVQARTEWTKGSPPLIPARLKPSSPAAPFRGLRSFSSGVGSTQGAVGTTRVVQTARRGTRNISDTTVSDWVTEIAEAAQERGEEMQPLFSQYIGFHRSLSGLAGLTMVTYDWSQGPTTFVERQPIRPSGQIQKNKIAALLRGEPHYVGISAGAGMLAGIDENGWLHLDNLPMWFIGEVMEVYLTTNLEVDVQSEESESSEEKSDGCTVRPLYGDPAFPTQISGGDIEHVWCFTGSWIEVTDVVLCFYIGHPKRQWVAVGIPPVVTDKYCPPPDSCRFTGTTSCPDCDEPGDKEGEIVDNIPDLLECIGNTQE